MTAVIGHVYSIDFPQQYNSWEKTDPNDLFEARTIRLEANPKVGVGEVVHSVGVCGRRGWNSWDCGSTPMTYLRRAPFARRQTPRCIWYDKREKV